MGRALVVVLLLAPSFATAQDARPELPELSLAPCPDAAAVTLRADGALLASPAWHACVVARLRGLAELVPYVRLLEERLRVDDERIELRDRERALVERGAELAREEARIATEALDAALRRAAAAEAELNAWYRHPAFLVGLGVVLTVLLEVAAVFALREVTP